MESLILSEEWIARLGGEEARKVENQEDGREWKMNFLIIKKKTVDGPPHHWQLR